MGHIELAKPVSLFGLDPPDIEEMKAYGEKLSEARRMLSNWKGEMLREHKQECHEKIQEMQDTHSAWWAELKKLQKEQWRERISARLERNDEHRRRIQEGLDRDRARADELRWKIQSSRNDRWAARSQDRVRELEDKITSKERQLREIKEKIREDEDKLYSDR